jgi:septum formation protein
MVMIEPTSTRLILASGSPRRRELLAELRLPFDLVASEEPENLSHGADAEAQAIALAERKAQAVAGGLASGLVLGADTIVALDAELLGKPADEAEAARMLRRLSGREHSVVTGVALVDAETGACQTGAATSHVRFRPLTEEEIAAYVATGEPRDKAGAYAIQGLGANLVAGLSGCYANVVGLPLCEVARLLTASGVTLPASWSGCRLPDGDLCPREI